MMKSFELLQKCFYCYSGGVEHPTYSLGVSVSIPKIHNNNPDWYKQYELRVMFMKRNYIFGFHNVTH